MKINEVEVGENSELDENVLIGYFPGRSISNKKIEIGRNAIIRAGTIIYAGSIIGDSLETGHNVIIREENKIGDNFSIWSNSVIDYGCKIGNNVKIHNNCYIAQFTTIEDDVFVGPGVVFANDIHPGCKLSKKCMRGPTIKRGATIGCNSTILPFLIIGRNSFIGAGSVVTRNVQPESIVYGNPAKHIKSIYDLKCVRGLIDKPYTRP